MMSRQHCPHRQAFCTSFGSSPSQSSDSCSTLRVCHALRPRAKQGSVRLSEPFFLTTRKGEPMRVQPNDGVCRACGGPLDITDADDSTMTVECSRCGESYPVEHDAFNDGAMHYFPHFMADQITRGDTH